MPWINDAFWQQLAIGIAGGLLGIIGALLAAQLSSRGKPKKELSYDLRIERALPEIGKELAPHVAIRYKDRPVPALYVVTCKVENTGNTVVKGQQIRFDLTPAHPVLETYFAPKPEPEWEIEELPETEETPGPNYRFGHLAPGRKITIKIILAAPEEPKVEVRDFNPTEHVPVLPRTSTARANVQVRARIAVALLLALLVIPQAFYALGSVGDIAAPVVQLGLVAALAPFAPSLIRALVHLLFRPAPRINLDRGIVMYDGEIRGVINFSGEPADVPDSAQTLE
ncbi:hypothetical protein [Streptosporangium canum]|uniref:hypothetical protein n=1 Tax=Streptosporangium canum TaxID=324952 RepID=UPI0037B5238E